MQLKAHELVSILSGLVGMSPNLLAQIANVPTKNLISWLAGKQNNLQLRSVHSVMSVLGLNVSAQGVSLLPDRVHCWRLNDTGLAKKDAYRGLKMIFPLLKECALTEVVSGGARRDKFKRYYMLRGLGQNQVRVLLSVNMGRFKKPKISPELLKYTAWRDESEDHILTVKDPVYWGRLISNDLTPYEFDWVFHDNYDKVTWSDVSLMARETGTRPSDLMSFIHQRAEQSAHRQPSVNTSTMELADNVILLPKVS